MSTARRSKPETPLHQSGSGTAQHFARTALNGGPGTGRGRQWRGHQRTAPGLDPRPICEGSLGRESERSAGLFLAGPAAASTFSSTSTSRPRGDDVHEVTLKFDVSARSDNGVHFVVDLSYAGLFGIRNVPAGSASAVPSDRGAAAALPVRSPGHCRRGREHRLSAAVARPDRLRRRPTWRRSKPRSSKPAAERRRTAPEGGRQRLSLPQPARDV